MRKIGLVLSGGLGKGAYQIGALKAISEYLNPEDFKYTSAASIGALNAYGFLSGQLDAAYDIWDNLNRRGHKRYVTSLLRGSNMYDIINSILSDEKLSSSLYIPLMNLKKRKLDYYDIKNLPPKEAEAYLRACIAIPVYKRGIKIGDETLYDGAFIDNIPVAPVLCKDLDYIFCIYFDDYNYIFEDYKNEDRVIKLAFNDEKFIMNTFNISKESVTKMLTDGYDRTKEILKKIFADGVDDIDAVKKHIAEKNAAEPKRRLLRISADVMVTNMNKVTEKIIRRKKNNDI